jgi:murein DD-endopeptidase MepM/ murein hydrolase activator NlpD
LVSPVPNHRITTPYRKEGKLWKLGYHTGIDYKAATGTNVVAAQAGRVLEVSQRVSWGESYGTAVIVLHRDMTRAIYAHLSKTNVVRGQAVAMGERIGKVGNTGNSTGSHLHFEVRKGNNATGEGYKYGDDVDPMPYLSDDEVTLGLNEWKDTNAKPAKPTNSTKPRRPSGSGGSKPARRNGNGLGNGNGVHRG